MSHRFSLHSLRSRMLALGVLAILPALGLILYTGVNQRNSAAFQSESEIVRLVRLIKTEHDQDIEWARAFLMTVNSHLAAHLNDHTECNPILMNLEERHAEFSNIAVANRDGSVICSSDPGLISHNISTQIVFRNAVENKQFSAGDYALNPDTGKPERIFGYPVYDIWGDAQAITFVNLALETLQPGVAALNLPPGSVTLLIDKNGRLLSRDPHSEPLAGQALADAPIMQTILAAGSEGTSIEVGLDGIKRLYAFIPLGSDQVPEAYFAVGVPLEAAHAKANQTLMANLAGLGIVAVIAIIAALLYSETFILRKIRAIFGATEKIGRGDLSARTGLNHESSELGQLASAFDEMAEALQSSENQYKNLVDKLPIGIYRNTPEPEGKLLMANNAFLQIFGYASLDELHSIFVSDLYVDPDERRQFSDDLLHHGNVSGVELQLKKKDGTPIWASVTARVVHGEDGQVAYFDGSIEDISERKDAERRRQRAEEKFRSLFEKANDGISFVSLDGEILDVNQKAAELIGYDIGELVGMDVRELMDESSAEDVMNRQNALRQHGEIRPYERSLIRKDGARIWVEISLSMMPDENGNPAYTQGILRDITERKRSEELLRESEEKYRKVALAVEQSANLVIITDRHGLIEYINPKFAEVTGYSLEELRGKTPRVLKSGETAPEAYEALWKTITSGKVWKGHFHNTKKNGDYYWAAATISPMRNSEGEITNFVGVEEDFTEQMYQSQLLRDQEEKLRSIIEQAGDGIALIDETGVLVEWNRAQELITGVNREKVLGRPFWEVIPRFSADEKMAGDFKRRLKQAVTDFYSAGQAPWFNKVSEHVIEKPDGTAGFIQNVYFPIRTARGYMAGCITRDITEVKRSELELRELQEFNDTIINSMNEGILIDDAGGRVVFANRALADLLGYSQEEIIGKPYMEIIPPDQHSIIESAYERRHRGLSDQYEFQMLGKNGARLHMLVSGTPRYENGTFAGTMGVFTDITERKKAEDQIKRQLSNMSVLRTIDKTIASSLDLSFTLHVLVTQIAAALGVDAAGILLYNPEGQTLDYAANHGFHSAALQHTHLRLGQGLAGRAALERSMIHVPDLQNTDTSLRSSPKLGEEHFTEYFGMPLFAKGRIKGVLELFSRQPLDRDHEWLDLLNALSSQAAIAIDGAETYRELQRSNQDLLLAYEFTLEGWAKALEIRDGETQGHTERVTELTVRLARNVGLAEDELAHIRRGARLHDIGKMGIPDSILLKPGPLTAEEWEVMHRHPTYAFDLLSPIPFLRPALDIPYCHHEKWDGSGYPRGLQGDDIPLAARIFAVVDVWDALRSDRPYRKSWPEETVIEYIREQSGKHFDPQVVEIFLELIASTGLKD